MSKEGKMTTENGSQTASKIQNPNPNPRINNLFIFGSTLAGVVVGVVAALAMTGPMLRTQVANATNGSRVIAARNADATLACGTASGASGNAGSVLGAFTAATTPPGLGGGGGGAGGGGNTFVNKLVSGVFATTTATISGNGANSTNKVTTVNKNTTIVHNDNDVNLTNNNSQTATSGDADTNHNVSGGGTSATTGTAENSSDTNMQVNITN
jgi:hypothetical protein